MCNNVTISNKWLITTMFKINILSSAVEMFVAEKFHYNLWLTYELML